MREKLHHYLLLHKRLVIPGVGMLRVETTPAYIDYAKRLIEAPTQSITLHHGNTGVEEKLYSWLANSFSIGEQEAHRHFENFCKEMKESILAGQKMNWQGIGSFSRGLAGQIHFQTAMKDIAIGKAIVAEKVLRENVEHEVRVGEQVKTSGEMLKLLTVEKKTKSYWWVAAALLISAVIYIGYYFSTQGVSTRSAGNRQQVIPSAAPVDHVSF